MNCGLGRLPSWIFLGFGDTVGYYFYLKHENKIFVARSGAFLEKEYLSRRARSEGVHLEKTPDDETTVNTPSIETTDTPQELVPSYIKDPILIHRRLWRSQPLGDPIEIVRNQTVGMVKLS
ncbi:hypothetical protein LIER_14054 [Lithospermum erythrorhizon]|uniref:Uncharacterized protein n=1 Tax=Lithospermum erythrorhizon TaxID=34254 RepID=A0AAV3Q1U8_LITER